MKLTVAQQHLLQELQHLVSLPPHEDIHVEARRVLLAHILVLQLIAMGVR